MTTTLECDRLAVLIDDATFDTVFGPMQVRFVDEWYEQPRVQVRICLMDALCDGYMMRNQSGEWFIANGASDWPAVIAAMRLPEGEVILDQRDLRETLVSVVNTCFATDRARRWILDSHRRWLNNEIIVMTQNIAQADRWCPQTPPQGRAFLPKYARQRDRAIQRERDMCRTLAETSEHLH